MRKWRYLIFLFVSAVTSEYDKAEWKEVNIKQGPVRGFRDSTGKLWSFYNIPYATAPKDKQKFKAPLPPPTWTELFDAVDKGIVCPQFYWERITRNKVISENCLITNVHVPDTEKENLSVLVYVHGGGFQFGFGEISQMKNLMMHKDMIVVNFNYRLGIHGFLCLGTDNVPGNAGMKDQVALLRWVQGNIHSFGGNPNDVTIVGDSAGSVSVDLLMISKLAEGLFHKVIPASGASLAAYSIQTNPLQIAKEHAKKLNFTVGDNIFELEDFYKSLPYETLTADSFLYNADSTFRFSPCIEQNRYGAFLTKSPHKILKTGDYNKVPLLYGFANMEGLIRIDNFEMWKNQMNENFSDFLTPDLKFVSVEEREAVARTIKQFYFGDDLINNDNILDYIDFFSDVFAVQPFLWAVKLHLKAGHNQIYLYEYSFVDKDTPVIPYTSIRGANHTDQWMAICDGKHYGDLDEGYISTEFKEMKRTLREMWRNFINIGKPVPEGSSLPAWPPVRANNSPYMSLGQKVELRDTIAPERFKFWQNIYQKYYREPTPPSSHFYPERGAVKKVFHFVNNVEEFLNVL